jgi:predicted component of type VI protein secretion system
VEGKARLGKDILVGTRCRDRQGQITVVIGPLTHRQLVELLPGGRGQARIRALVRLYARQPLDICLRLVVPREELDRDRRYRIGGGELRRLGRGAIAGTPAQKTVNFEFVIPMNQPAATQKGAA